MYTNILKIFSAIGIGLAIFCGALFAFDGGFTWDNDIGVSNAFFAMNPTNGEIIDALYGDGNGGTDATYYTQPWNTNACNPSAMDVVVLGPGTNTIPVTLAGNTIYVLNAGVYTITQSTTLNGDCIGVVGSGNVTINRPTGINLFGSSGMNNTIFANMTIDGQSYGATLITIRAGENNSLTDLSIKRADLGIALYTGGHNYIHNTLGQLCNYSLHLEYSNFNILDHFEFSSNYKGGIEDIGAHDNLFQNGLIYNGIYSSNNCYEGPTELWNYGQSDIFNNVQTFNNNAYAACFEWFSNISIDNTLAYNNGYGGFRGGQEYVCANTHIYNNGGDGAWGQWLDDNNIFYNDAIYNNAGYGIDAAGSYSNMYFGIHQSFDNAGGDFYNTVAGTGGDTRVVDIGLATGSLDSGYTMDCSWAAVPLGANLGVNCTTKNHMSFTPTYTNNILFTFGSHIKKQSQPIIWNTGNTGVIYSSLSYDTGLYAGQFVQGGITGNQHIYTTNPVSITTLLSLWHGNAVGTGAYTVRGDGLTQIYTGVMNNTGTLSVDITNGYGNKVIYVQYKVGNTYSDVYSTYIPVSLPQTDAIVNAISLYSGSVPLAGQDIVMKVEYGATQDVVSGYIDFYSSTGLSINVAQNPGWSDLGGNTFRYFLGDFSGGVGRNYLYLTATVLSGLPEGFVFQTTGYIDSSYIEINPSDNQFPFSFSLFNSADLAITGTMDKVGGYVSTGDNVTYTINVKNNGPYSADTTLQVLLDTGLSYLTGTPGYTDIVSNGTGTFAVTGDACYDDFLVNATGAYMDAINNYIVMSRGQPSLYDMLVARYGFTGTSNEAPAYLKYLCTDPRQRGYKNMRTCMTNSFGINFNDSAFSGCGAPFLYLSGSYYDEFLNETGVYRDGFTTFVITNGWGSSIYNILTNWYGFTGNANESAEYLTYLCSPSNRGYTTLSDCLERNFGFNMDDYFDYTTPLSTLGGYIRNLGTISSGYNGNIVFHALVLSGANPTLTSPVNIVSSSYDSIMGNNQFDFINHIGFVPLPPPTPTPTPSGGGGGGILQKDDCPDGDFSPSYYDHSCGTAPETTHGAAAANCTIQGSTYSSEMNDAFQYACNLGITDNSSIQKDDIEGYVMRKEAAKMISLFATQELNIKKTIHKVCRFSDINNEPEILQEYMKLSCRLGIMGLKQDGTPDSIFNPNQYITRAQFGTMLSRLLYDGIYNVALSSNIPWYQNHLQALQKEVIMTQISNPITRKEMRGWIILMMYRIAQKNKNK